MEEGRAAWPVGVGMITPTSNSNITCHTIHTTPCHAHLLNPVSKVTTTTTAIISTFPLSQPTGASSTEEEASVLGKNTGSMLLLLPPSLHHSLIITSPFPLPRPNGTAATMTAYSRCRSTKSHFTSGLHTILYKPTALDASTVKQWLVWSGRCEAKLRLGRRNRLSPEAPLQR